MKISIWDILSIILLIGTVIVALVVIQIFTNPDSGLNPFPPPILPTDLVLPSPTNTPLRLPPTWTPSSSGGEVVPTPTLPSGLRSTWTLVPSSTGFIVSTWTPTVTPTFTPTNTLTPTNTPTHTPVTPTKTPNMTKTYNALKTQISAGQTATAAAKPTNTSTPKPTPTSTKAAYP